MGFHLRAFLLLSEPVIGQDGVPVAPPRRSRREQMYESIPVSLREQQLMVRTKVETDEAVLRYAQFLMTSPFDPLRTHSSFVSPALPSHFKYRNKLKPPISRASYVRTNYIQSCVSSGMAILRLLLSSLLAKV